MTTKFRTNYDQTYPISDTGAKIWLSANLEQTYTVPGTADQKYRAKFTYASTAEIWIKLNGTIIQPIPGTQVATYNEELRPDKLFVVGGDVIHCISTGTPQLGISLLALYD